MTTQPASGTPDSDPETDAAHLTAELAARNSYGRLIAYLAARTRNIAAAEDALAEAFASALTHWPRTGVPDQPEAWLLTVARRAHGKVQRHQTTTARAEPDLILLLDTPTMDAMLLSDATAFPDDRLKLLFACTHPALDPAARTPLMLQVVMGLPADRIASAFLTAPATMSQRLVRAKARLRDTGAGFTIPDAADLPDRLEAVAQAIFAAFGTAWETGAGAGSGSGSGPSAGSGSGPSSGSGSGSGSGSASGGPGSDLASEAIFLAEMLVVLLPDEPETHGLLALLLHAHARRHARRDATGAYVPLSGQDPARWDGRLQSRADASLRHAASLRRFGRFQCEAAIQSVHAARAVTGRTDLAALETLYDALARLCPIPGVAVARAAVLGQRHGAVAGIDALDALTDPALVSYQPYWAVRAHLLAAQAHPDAASAYDRAIGLTEDPAVRAYLLRQSGRLQSGRL